VGLWKKILFLVFYFVTIGCTNFHSLNFASKKSFLHDQDLSADTQVGPLMQVGQISGIPCNGVSLNAGMTINDAVAANPPGTIFCLAPGTYAQQSIQPKDGDTFIGSVGTVLDGQNAVVYAIQNTGNNVTLRNLIIQNYMPAQYNAAVHTDNVSGWTVTNCEIRYNAASGLEIASGMTAQGNYLHHNLQDGFTHQFGVTTYNVFFDSNEIAFNNYTDAFWPTDEAGGGKFWDTNGLMVTHNYSHDNHGPGLWDDFNNINVTYAYNWIENNSLGGIFHEISYNASIHDNVLRNDARLGTCPGWMFCSEIGIADSGGVNGGSVEVYNNSITVLSSQAGNGIGLIQQNRGTGSYGEWLTQNVHVHDNTVDQSNPAYVDSNGNLYGLTGAVQDVGSNAIFASRNNTFQNNTYILGNNSQGFVWNGLWLSLSQWQAAGNDVSATQPTPTPAPSDQTGNGVVILAGGQIVDGNGTVFTFDSAGFSYRNGVADGGANIVKMTYWNGSVYADTTAYGQWVSTADGWIPAN